MSSITKISIIGGGASGTITAIHLLHEFKGPLKIYMFEKRQKALFRGNAYSGELESELLNVPAGKMSVFSNLPNDFYDWLRAKRQRFSESVIKPESFVSRRWFGDYVTDRLEEAKAIAANATFEVIVSEVRDISLDKKAEHYKVVLANGDFVSADYLIFATGNEQPSDVLNNFENALFGKKYVPDPWAVNPFENLEPDDDVLIMGTGLSMVDHAISLHKRKHRGKIYSFSRHGYLPLPQLIGQDGKVEFSPDTSQILHVLNELRATVNTYKKKGLHWQQIINAMRDDTPVVWKQLSIRSKQLFLKRLKHFWEVHRHRMPAESSQIIEELKANDKLEMLAGKNLGFVIQDKKKVFHFATKSEKIVRAIKVDYVINCTGPSGNYVLGNNWLIKNLLTKGWMKQDELQLGIITGAQGEIITGQGTPLPNAYAIGPLRKATEWESTAIREIKMQAEQLALDIALNYREPELLTRLSQAR